MEAREKILEALEAEADAKGVDVVDVEVTGAGGQACVTVRLDHADETLPTITLDEVASLTDWVSSIVESVDPFDKAYMLEVSSPGLDRPLRKPRDFERFAGETVALTTTATEGRKRYTGQLKGLEDERVAVACDGETFTFELSEIKTCKIKPKIDFSSSGDKKRG